MKTLKWLNEHWWYRLIKVVFLLLIIFSCVVAIWVNIASIDDYQTDYLVVCNYGNKSTFLANKDKGIYYIPSYYDYTDSLAKLPDETKVQLQRACGLSSDDTVNILVNTIGKSDSQKLFDLTQTKVYINTVWTTLLWSIVSVVIITLIAEIIRRAFYYIFLGSLRPKKE